MAGRELWTEVRVSFAGTLLQVTHLRPGQRFTLGEGPEADLTYACPGLHRLVMATATGAVLERPGSCGALVALGAGESVCIELGGEGSRHRLLSLEIRCGPGLAPALGRRPVDLGWWSSFAGSALLIAAFLGLARMVADAAVPVIETDAAPYLIYTARSEPVAEEPRRDSERPPPPERQRASSPRGRRASARSSDTPNAAARADEGSAEEWPDAAQVLHVVSRRPGAQPIAPALQRDSSPVEAARRAGVLGSIDEEDIATLVSVAADAFDPEVDDRVLWAAMTDGPLDATIGGLALSNVGRGGGEASEVVRAGAPLSPKSTAAPAMPGRCLGSACEGPLRARVHDTRVEGELDPKRALRFANSLRGEWIACLDADEAPVEFELGYTVHDGSVSGAKVSRTQLSSRSRRCIVAALERGPGLDASADGRSTKVVQRVVIE